ncbi:MAG: RnfABCDGE type electron transport complex subunit D [Clostridia bacterium]|nr:RnfABCDGE type electron transport complex subunit D [Clostridia bacterium]
MGRLLLTSNPHIRSGRTTQSIMLDVLIALVPAVAASLIFFPIRGLAVLGVCVAVCVLCEFLFDKITKKENTIQDLSAVVTGVLLALNLPYTIPLWQAAFGALVAIVVVKCLFGGIGQNFANPAITGRIVLLLCFKETGSATVTRFMNVTDGVTTATPLSTFGTENAPSTIDLLIGNVGGAMGETCKIALLIGFLYLLIRKVITWHTPVVFIGTVFVFSLIVTGSPADALSLILSGGLFLGAIFMATDYATTPYTPWGKVLFGLGCGLIVCVIRFWGSLPEGVSYAILLMNILTPFIEKLTAPKAIGGKKA